MSGVSVSHAADTSPAVTNPPVTSPAVTTTTAGTTTPAVTTQVTVTTAVSTPAKHPSGWTDAASGELVAAIVMVALVFGLVLVGRRTRQVVTAARTTYNRQTTDASGNATTTPVTLLKGAIIPTADNGLVTPADVTTRDFSPMRLLVVGKDGRTSTSKAVAFAWTLAVIFGLLAILFAKLFGDKDAYNALIQNGLREDYWLLLGGPYAAAILAKYATTSQAQDGGKTTATDGANVQQLVVNDEGEGDLGDFQYVAFNLVALLYFFVLFVPHLNSGIPEMPKTLSGLALTSAGVYSAKKFLSQAPPTLLSLMPNTIVASTAASTSSFQVWGNNLILPASVTSTGTADPPLITINGVAATVTAYTQTIGADNVTVALPVDTALVAGSHVKIMAVRADGVTATGPGGTDGLMLSLT
jgi:hypothetical protein